MTKTEGKNDDIRLLCVGSFDGFIVRYYQTTANAEDSGDGQAPYPYYGVLLEKYIEGNSNPVETASIKGISENAEVAEHVIQALNNHKVTPLSLYEVIDQIIEIQQT